MDFETIEFERQDHIGILTLNRPERLNALSLTMFDELRALFTTLCDDLDTRVIILRGAGRGFCAGLDLNLLKAGAEMDPADRNQFVYRKIQVAAADLPRKIHLIPQPVIAAVHGSAAGGGFSLAMACDIRIAAESARFNAAFIRIGVSGCDMGSSYFLPRLIGLSRAAEYLYTGKFMDAATADRIGLVSKVVPDEQLMGSTLELAQDILRNSPLGIRMTKETLNLNVDASSLESALQLENRTQMLCSMTEDAKEGPRAFLDKRPPAWQDK